MNADQKKKKILNNALTNQIHQYPKRIKKTHEFIRRMPTWLNYENESV